VLTFIFFASCYRRVDRCYGLSFFLLSLWQTSKMCCCGLLMECHAVSDENLCGEPGVSCSRTDLAVYGLNDTFSYHIISYHKHICKAP